MKKVILFFVAGIFGGKLTAFADVEQAKKLSPLQRAQISWALKIISETKTVSMSENQCLKVDDDILSILEAGGHIERASAQPNVVCVGAEK